MKMTLTQEDIGRILAHWVGQRSGPAHCSIKLMIDDATKYVTAEIEVNDDGYKPADPVFLQPASSGIGGQDQPATDPVDQPEA